VLGTLIRVHALSQYKFYPDSYQPLVVAENIRTQGSVVGEMGQEGLVYPDFFEWTRPLYPLLIVLGTVVLKNNFLVAHILSFFAGVLAIPLSYLFLSAVFKSKEIALIGSALTALSYSAAIWGGFILTDTTALALMLLFLWMLIKNSDAERGFLSLADVSTGCVFALVVATRYELFILVLPLIYLLYTAVTNPFSRLATIGLSAGAIWSILYIVLSPFYISGTATQSQFGSLVDSFGAINTTGLSAFVLSDFLLVSCFLVGSYQMLTQGYRIKILVFAASAIVLLGLAYYQINPAIQRYFIHLIPFLLVPASYGAFSIIKRVRNLSLLPKIASVGVGFALVVVQADISFAGLHNKDNGLWFEPGYEAQAALITRDLVPNDAMLVVSQPEPYFLIHHLPTQSIVDTPPYLYLRNTLPTKKIVVIDDEGMRYLFPKFHTFLTDHLARYKMHELSLAAPFRYAGSISDPTEGISVYQLSLQELTGAIAQQQP
jgi:hypothetical protein